MCIVRQFGKANALWKVPAQDEMQAKLEAPDRRGKR